jgi:hypothetical protein
MRDREIPRGTIIGKVTGGKPLTEAEHFWKCEACGGYFDMRDLGAVLTRSPCRIRRAIRCSSVAGSSAQIVGAMDAGQCACQVRGCQGAVLSRSAGRLAPRSEL